MVDNEQDDFEQYLMSELDVNEDCNLAEKLYNNYNEMQKSLKSFEKKYGKECKHPSNPDFKQGFIAGVNIMLSLFITM